MTWTQSAPRGKQLQSEAWDLWLDCLTLERVGELRSAPLSLSTAGFPKRLKCWNPEPRQPSPASNFEVWQSGSDVTVQRCALLNRLARRRPDVLRLLGVRSDPVVCALLAGALP